jgi:hypothetical protein
MRNKVSMPWHVPLHPDWTNKTIDWHPTDTEESFNRMMQDPVHRAYFAEQGWDKPGAITYSFNRYGFRSDEFDLNADNLVALGCSFTMGIGLPVKDTWPSILAQALNLRVCNLAWGGGSSDRCFRMAEFWVPHLKPKLVVLLNPPRGRLEIVIDEQTGETEGIIPSDTHSDTFVKRWLSVDTNQRLNNRKNSLAIQALCNELNIPFLSYEADEWMSRSREDAGYARDYFHAGPKGHRSFTERIINDFTTAK